FPGARALGFPLVFVGLIVPTLLLRWATAAIDALSLHDALPISDFRQQSGTIAGGDLDDGARVVRVAAEIDLHGRVEQPHLARHRSEEHTSELQSRENLVCRLLLEKKKTPGKEARKRVRGHRSDM